MIGARYASNFRTVHVLRVRSIFKTCIFWYFLVKVLKQKKYVNCCLLPEDYNNINIIENFKIFIQYLYSVTVVHALYCYNYEISS